jgi:hypothetical protein
MDNGNGEGNGEGEGGVNRKERIEWISERLRVRWVRVRWVRVR